MRLKSFTATDMKDALHQVRMGMGDEAVIISTTRIPGGKGVRVTAAMEAGSDEELPTSMVDPSEITGEAAIVNSVFPEDDFPSQPALPGMSVSATAARVVAAMKSRGVPTSSATIATFPTPTTIAKAPVSVPTQLAAQDVSRLARVLEKALTYHNAPPYVVEKITRMASESEGEKLEELFVSILETAFAFPHLPLAPGTPPIMLVGPAGVGKTIAVSKIATAAVIGKMPVNVITTDTTKAGGIEQLKAFTDILRLPLNEAHSPEELKRAIQLAGKSSLIIIDSAGANPYNAAELKELGTYVAVGDIEPVLVMPAGMDAYEAVDAASNFSYLGVRQMIITKVDAARRFGSILAAAHSGGLGMAYFSRGSGPAQALERVRPQALAKLLLSYKE